MRVVFAVNSLPNMTPEQIGGLASARYRGFIPAAALKEAGVQAEVISVFDLFRPEFDTAIDLLVLHQPKHDITDLVDVISILFDRMAAIRARGGVIALDVSDFKFTPEHHARMTERLGPGRAENYRLILDNIFARSTAVTAPTEALAAMLRTVLRDKLPVFVVDDVVEVAPQPARFAPAQDGAPLKLLWFGMMSSHVEAMQRFLKYDLPRIDAIRPTALHLVCEPLQAAAGDGGLVVHTGSRDLRVPVTPWSVAALQQALDACDLVVLPFDVDSHLSRGKSNNRALQALYAGRYVLAHPIDSYLVLGDYIGLDRDLAAAAATALADPAATLARLQRGQAHVADTYSPPAIGRRWRELAQQLLPPKS
jgi:hypothetical protein